MSIFDVICIVLGAWGVLGCLGGFAWSFAAGRLKRNRPQHTRRPGPFTDHEGTVWAPSLPAVPPPAPRFPQWDDVDEIAFRWFAEGQTR